MIKEFIIADLLLKIKISKNKIIFIVSVFNIVLYCLLIGFFYAHFKSTLVITAIVLLLSRFYFIRLPYLKKYLHHK